MISERTKFILQEALYFMRLNFSRYTNCSLPAPILVGLEITKRCNLQCMHCDIRSPKYSDIANKELSINEIKKLIDSLKSFGTAYISISGGEPFLRNDIFDVIEYAKKVGLGLYISSNGTLITKEIAKKVNDLGLDAISISVDAVTPEIHDKIRGMKTFDKTIAAIKNLVNYRTHTQVCISPLIANFNFDEILRIVDFAKDLGVNAIVFNPWHASLGHKGTEKIFNINENHLVELENVIKQIIEKTRKYNIYTNSEFFLKEIKNFYRNGEIKIECYAGFSFCNISWKGDVVPCAFIPAVGNIRKEPFEKIWHSQRFNSVRKEIRKGNCPGCWMRCFIEPSLRCSLKYALRNPFKYISDLQFYYQNIK